MTNVTAVVGSAYGDCGKGLITDYYSSKLPNSIVVRYNGSCQSGHTVETPDGQRHVFSHFGAGTFNDVPTYLSEHFVCNPILFFKEHNEFVKDFGFKPKIYVHPDCLMTTIYDMLINQELEKHRGDKRHGSCGMGFGETIERAETFNVIKVKHLEYTNPQKTLKNLLHSIVDYYIPDRLFNKPHSTIEEVLPYTHNVNRTLISNYIRDCLYFLMNVNIADIGILEKYDNLIFEGGQGLLLDPEYGTMPYCTRSNCGTKNIAEILRQLNDIDEVNVNYLTRAYSTRHGAGPLDNEAMQPLPYHIVDETNVKNEFQHHLRFAPLNLDTYAIVTQKDLLYLYDDFNFKVRNVMTCMDQVEEVGIYIEGGTMYTTTAYKFHNYMKEMFSIMSFGRTREWVNLRKNII